MAYWMIEDHGKKRPADPIEEEGPAVCSECGGDALESTEEEYVWSRFCPHCGAKMGNWQTEEQREAAFDKSWERYKAKERERWERMTPEERAFIENNGPRGATGPCWREEDGE